MWYMYVKDTPDSIIHIHHWFISFGSCLLFRYDDIFTNIMFSILFGIFIQGSVSYGLADIFTAKKQKDINQKDIIDNSLYAIM